MIVPGLASSPAPPGRVPLQPWLPTDRQRPCIPLPGGTVHSCQPISGAEVQVSTTAPQHLKQVRGVVQLGRKTQRAL